MDTVVLRQAITSLTDTFGADATEIGAMQFMVRRSVRLVAKKQGGNAEGLLKRLDRCVESHCIDCDIHPGLVAEVISALDHDLALARSS